MPATNSEMLIGLARNGCPWIFRPGLVSALKELEVSVAIGATSIAPHLSYQQSKVGLSSSNSALVSYLLLVATRVTAACQATGFRLH